MYFQQSSKQTTNTFLLSLKTKQKWKNTHATQNKSTYTVVIGVLLLMMVPTNTLPISWQFCTSQTLNYTSVLLWIFRTQKPCTTEWTRRWMNIQNTEAVHESVDKAVDEYSEHRSRARVSGQGGGWIFRTQKLCTSQWTRRWMNIQKLCMSQWTRWWMNIQNTEAVHESMDKAVDEYSEYRSCAWVNGQGSGWIFRTQKLCMSQWTRRWTFTGWNCSQFLLATVWVTHGNRKCI